MHFNLIIIEIGSSMPTVKTLCCGHGRKLEEIGGNMEKMN
jgi:hypothetical protein